MIRGSVKGFLITLVLIALAVWLPYLESAGFWTAYLLFLLALILPFKVPKDWLIGCVAAFAVLIAAGYLLARHLDSRDPLSINDIRGGWVWATLIWVVGALVFSVGVRWVATGIRRKLKRSV